MAKYYTAYFKFDFNYNSISIIKMTINITLDTTPVLHYNKDKCLARLSSNKNKQCKNNKLNNGYFCGIHSKSKKVFRIDKPVLLDNEHKLLTLNDTEQYEYSKIKQRDIIHTLKHYNLIHTHKKQPNYTKLCNFLRLLGHYDTNNIIKIQTYFRGFRVRHKNRLKGPGLFKRHLINNECDFLTFETCKNILYNKFFSYIDTDGFIYAFNIESIKYLIDHKEKNPYNRKEFTPECIAHLNKLVVLCEESGQSTAIHFEEDTDGYSKMKHLCVRIFQKMDELELYTQPRWFLDLSIYKLKRLYKEIEDIWNYRAYLSKEAKLNYTKNGKAFTIPLYQINKMTDTLKLQNILLNEFYTFAFDGKTKEDCVTSCYWILTGLTCVSTNAAQGCPELVQSNVN